MTAVPRLREPAGAMVALDLLVLATELFGAVSAAAGTLAAPAPVRDRVGDLLTVSLHAQTKQRRAGVQFVEHDWPTLRACAVAAALTVERWVEAAVRAARAGERSDLVAAAGFLASAAECWIESFAPRLAPASDHALPPPLSGGVADVGFAMTRAADLLHELVQPPAAQAAMADMLATQALAALRRAMRELLALVERSLLAELVAKPGGLQ